MHLNTPDFAINEAIATVAAMSQQATDGKWLELETADTAPLIPEWDVSNCWTWPDWPGRDAKFPDATGQDIGIDCVAVRRSDGK